MVKSYGDTVDSIIDILVSYDGTWCGYTANFGIDYVISEDTLMQVRFRELQYSIIKGL